MITLYHGTNAPFDTPDPNRGRKGTDFGQGFYLTPDLESAINIAGLSVARSGTGRKTVLVYEFDETMAATFGLNMRNFSELNAEWMSFVIANRTDDRNRADHNIDRLYDVVSGLVADDKIVTLLRRYQMGELTQDDILHTLQQRPWRTLQIRFIAARRSCAYDSRRFGMSNEQKYLFETATTDLSARVMDEEHVTLQQALHIVYDSKLYEKLQNPDTGLYREGPVYLYDMLCEERGTRPANLV